MRSYPHAPSHSHKPRPHAKGWDKKKYVYAVLVSGYVERGGKVHTHRNKHSTQSVTTNTTTKAATNYNQQLQRHTLTHGQKRHRKTHKDTRQTDKWYVCCELFLVPAKTSAEQRLKVLQMGLGRVPLTWLLIYWPICSLYVDVCGKFMIGNCDWRRTYGGNAVRITAASWERTSGGILLLSA